MPAAAELMAATGSTRVIKPVSLVRTAEQANVQSGYRADRFRIYLYWECSKEAVAKKGHWLGFTFPHICYSGQPQCDPLLAKDKNLSEVLREPLTNEPSVVSVRLGFWK